MEHFEYIVKRSRKRRKSIAITIDHDHKIVVHVPYQATDEHIQSIIAEKKDWIRDKLSQPRPTRLEFREGESIWWLGNQYPLHFESSIEKKRIKIDFDHRQLTIFHPIDALELKDQLRNKLIHWYQKQGYPYLLSRCQIKAKEIEVEFARIRINRAGKRWGSCSTQGNLNFSYRLLMTSPKIIDYVVVHELSHLIQPNHSQEFWQIVEKYEPNFRTHRSWLKENRHLFSI